MQNSYYLRKTGRVCYPFPWVSRQEPCPWNQSTHMRVLIPLSKAEKKKSQKKVHMQVVAMQNVVTVQPARIKLKQS